MTATFFITRKTDENLHDVAAAVFRALGVSDWEERDSSNYPPDNHYFAGYSKNAEVTVYDADDDRAPAYPFRVSITDASWRNGRGMIATDEATLVAALIASTFTVLFQSARGSGLTGTDMEMCMGPNAPQRTAATTS